MTIETRQAPDTRLVGEDLQATVVDLISLTLACKHAHWNVTGPTFRSVHLQLDEVVDAAREGTDRAAERLVTIGGVADGRPSSLSGADDGGLPAGTMTTEQATQAIIERLDDVTRRLRARITRAGEPDPISEGILIDIAEELEKQAWMLRAQRPGG